MRPIWSAFIVALDALIPPDTFAENNSWSWGMPRGGEPSGLRRELIEARTKIRRQLEILKGQASSGDLWGDNRELIAKLEQELRDVNVALMLGTRPNP